MSSRYYKAYGGPVVHPPGYMDCLREVEALPKFKGLTWYRSLLTRATSAQEEEKRRLVAECMARKRPPHVEPGDFWTLIGSLGRTIPPVYLLGAGAVVLVLVFLLGKAMK